MPLLEILLQRGKGLLRSAQIARLQLLTDLLEQLSDFAHVAMMNVAANSGHWSILFLPAEILLNLREVLLRSCQVAGLQVLGELAVVLR